MKWIFQDFICMFLEFGDVLVLLLCEYVLGEDYLLVGVE